MPAASRADDSANDSAAESKAESKGIGEGSPGGGVRAERSVVEMTPTAAAGPGVIG